MQSGGAFNRASAMASAIAGIIARLGQTFAGQAAINALGAYTSNGKRKTKTHSARCHRRDQRAAVKARNVNRNRKAHRG